MARVSRAEATSLLAEVFREHGYEATTLSVITTKTGLGKGSFYHFFPGGKEEAAAAVIADITSWFESQIFAPLNQAATAAPVDATAGIDAMIDAVTQYFDSGRRACLPSAFAVSDARDEFATAIVDYFQRWAAALATALSAAGCHKPADHAIAILAAIQGGITLARALDDPNAFQTAVNAARQNALGQGRE